MKNNILFITIISISILVINSSCSFKDNSSINKTKNIMEILKEFKKPHHDFAPAPLYVWNSKITKEGIEEDLIEFKNNGFGGIFVHPRPGLITEYLSDTWFNLFGFTVKKAKELDLNVWIYDENSYPSGFGGGHVPAEMPDSYIHGQGLLNKDTSHLPLNMSDYFLIYKKVNNNYVEITNEAKDEIGKSGEYSLISKIHYRKSDWFGGWSYVDLIYPGVTEKFIDVTMSGYEKISKDEFGKTIKGVFTDEPEINTPGGIRWTPDLFVQFKKDWNYSLRDNLPLLYKEVGEWKKVRHNYTQTMLKLFIARWSKPQNKYCEENNLIFTGHYWEHGWPSMKLGGDNMAMYAYHQMPGIDMLFNQFNEESNRAQFGNIRAVKELSSVANQLGRKRTLSETYGGGGWEETFEDFKRLGDWEFALGVNFLNQHLSHFTLAGARKYDYPPSFSDHSPWWRNYKYLNDYYTRLSYILSSGKQINKILIIEPTTTAWLYDSYIKKAVNDKNNLIGLSFQRFVTKLEKSQIEYDLGSEDIIKNHGSNIESNFIVGERSYSTVVIPPMTENINRSTYELLKKYISENGKIILFSNPTLIDGNKSEELIKLINSKNKNIHNFDKLTNNIISNHFECSDIKFTHQGGNLYHHRRIVKDGQIVFLVNSSLEEKTTGELLVEGKDAIALNPFNGNINDYPHSVDRKNVQLNIELQPAESILLLISKANLASYSSEPTKNKKSVITSDSKIKVSREKDNVLNIDFCDLSINGNLYKDINVYDAGKKVFKENGFKDGNPWNHSIQYKTSVLDRGNFNTESGFIATYKFYLNDKFDYTKIRAVVEHPELWNVFINGKIVKHDLDYWWLDQSFGVYSIGDFVKKGKNKIEIKCYPMNIHAEIEPIYIFGDFSVVAADKGWSIKSADQVMNLKSWKSQGMPFYSWDVSYSKVFQIINKDASYFVSIGDWKGTVAEVYANGKLAGVIALHTDLVDVSDYVVDGNNEIDVKIIGSLKNLFGPHHGNPKPGLVGPGHWRGTSNYPSGKEYHMLDYGLMGDINLIKN